MNCLLKIYILLRAFQNISQYLFFSIFAEFCKNFFFLRQVLEQSMHEGCGQALVQNAMRATFSDIKLEEQ